MKTFHAPLFTLTFTGFGAIRSGMKYHMNWNKPNGFSSFIVFSRGLVLVALCIHGCSQAPQGQESRPLGIGVSQCSNGGASRASRPPGSGICGDWIVGFRCDCNRRWPAGFAATRGQSLLAGNGPGILSRSLSIRARDGCWMSADAYPTGRHRPRI